jgi:hypothetical protein
MKRILLDQGLAPHMAAILTRNGWMPCMSPKSEWTGLRTSGLWKKLGLTKECVSRWTTISTHIWR